MEEALQKSIYNNVQGYIDFICVAKQRINITKEDSDIVDQLEILINSGTNVEGENVTNLFNKLKKRVAELGYVSEFVDLIKQNAIILAVIANVEGA